MAKEYIERDEAIKILFRTFECYWEIPCDPHDLLVQHMVCKVRDRIKESPAADVVEVVRPNEAVLEEFENDYKDFKKIKTHLAQIIVEGKVEEPYYSILWWDEESKEYNIGYSSYCLDYVRKWLELVFEVVDTADVVEVVRCKDCKHFGTDNCALDTYLFDGIEDGFCSYGERKDNDG